MKEYRHQNTAELKLISSQDKNFSTKSSNHVQFVPRTEAHHMVNAERIQNVKNVQKVFRTCKLLTVNTQCYRRDAMKYDGMTRARS